ncbi:tail fiber assembly protein [Salmonella enterica]|nr:tail fiber assembly protein [Salmonella enterica]
MSTYSYSSKTNSFYFIGFREDYQKNGSWPDDAIEVDDSVYVEFSANAAPAGKTRAGGSNGLPVWVDIPAPTQEQIIENNLRVRNKLMRACTDAAFPLQSALTRGVATQEQQSILTAIEDYSIKLLNYVNWTKSPLKLPPAPDSITALIA